MASPRWTALATLVVLAAPAAARVVRGAPAAGQDWRGRARLDGHVTDRSGTPLRGVTVTVESLAGTGGPVVRTDGEGGWVVDGIAAGSWSVEFSAPGYEPRRIGVHLPHESAWLGPLDVQLDGVPAALPPPPPAAAAAAAPPGEGGSGYRELRAALETGRVERAHELLASIDDETAAETDALVEMGTTFLTAGETGDAVTLLDRALEQDPAHVVARYRRALGLLALGRLGEARTDFERVLDLAPEGSVPGEKARRALEELPDGAPADR